MAVAAAARRGFERLEDGVSIAVLAAMALLPLVEIAGRRLFDVGCQLIAMPLSAGEHDFRLLYFQGPGHELALQLFVKGYKTPERLFGPEI